MQNRMRHVVIVAVCLASASFVMADDIRNPNEPRVAPAPLNTPLPPELARDVQAAIDRGLTYLKASQARDGGWTPKYGPGVTAIVAKAFAQDAAHGPKHPIVVRSAQRVLQHRQKDGGIYTPAGNINNYQTAVALSMLGALNDPAYTDAIKEAQAYLGNLQYDAGEKVKDSDTWFGGAGYTSQKRPDLSNTQMMVEALHDSGLPPTDPAYQRALKFITRCQNLASTNDQAFAKRNSDGGFVYSAANGGESKAGDEGGELFARGLRSYGTMTYAGFKSMLYANVSHDDPRVRAAYDWICKHYTLDGNANMPGGQSKQGLYYYYHVFVRALYAWGEPTITDGRNQVHNWRLELCRKLLSLQRKDGSWANDADRWNEGDPNYVTALAILSMQEAMKPAPLARAAENVEPSTQPGQLERVAE